MPNSSVVLSLISQATRLRGEAGELMRLLTELDARDLGDARDGLWAVLRDLRPLADRLDSAIERLPNVLSIGHARTQEAGT